MATIVPPEPRRSDPGAAMSTPDPDATHDPAPGPDGRPDTPDEGNVFTKVGAFAQSLVARVDGFQRRHTVTALPYAVIKKFGDDQAGNLAALVAYYSFFALFPLLLVLVTVVGFVLQNNPDAERALLDSALTQFPVVGDQLRDNLGSFKGSGVALAIGIIGALWGGLGSIEAMQNAMNSVWNVPIHKRPTMLVSRLRSLIMLVILSVAVGASSVLSSVSTVADAVPYLGAAFFLLLAAAVNSAMYLGAFTVLTEKTDVDWKVMLPGAVVAGVAFTILQTIGSWYVQHVLTGASRMYGTFAVVLGLLSWLYLLAQLSVYAAEVNVVVHERLWPRGILTDDLTDADRRALDRYAAVEERLPQEDVDVTLHEDGEAAATGRGDEAPDRPPSTPEPADAARSGPADPADPAEPVVPADPAVARGFADAELDGRA